jgi:hypothetical protein
MLLSIKLKGGLGNQLFQLFTCVAYGLEHKKQIILSQNKLELVSHADNKSPRPVYWDSFLSEFKKYIIDDIEYKKKEKDIKLLYKDEDEIFELIPYTEKNLMLSGYFQSYKYFESINHLIPSLLQLNDQRNNILMKFSFNINTIHISLHFRIGDYKAAGAEKHPILSIDYYINSLHYILNSIKNTTENNILVLCFGENQSKDDIFNNIDILSKQFTNIDFKFCNHNLQDYEEMILMSCCNHNIIANSTFSWWGAFLNNSSDKIITYPEQWFGENIKKDVSNLFPNHWTRISS